MKKLNYLLLGAAGLLMASCSQNNEAEAPQQGEGNYHITVNLPEIAGTRAFGDGYTANNLHYAVYDADNNNRFVSEGQTTFPTNQLWTTVDFQLAYGKNYVIVFFAQSATSDTNKAYTFSAEDHYVYVDYSKMASNYNQDYYDCFFRAYETGMLTNESQDATITLYRPVAQVNWGVSDIQAEMVTHSGAYGQNAQYLVSQVTGQAYTIFDMLLTNDDDEVVGGPIGAPKEITLAYLNRPTGQAFPYEPANYEYLSMQYLLVPAESSTVDLTLTLSNQGTAANPNPEATTRTMNVVVPNTPVQANYRTNIFGDLLTGDLNFKIVKEPAFNTPDYDVSIPQD